MEVLVIDLATLSLSGGGGVTEARVPLWWADGTYTTLNGSNSNSTVAGTYWLTDGQTGVNNTPSATAIRLFTLSSTWSQTEKFAFECSLTTSAGSIGPKAYAAIWDFTSSSIVSASQASTTTASTLTLVRSGQFTLTPGHIYGVTIWISSSGWNAWVSDASLIIFPS